MNVNFASMTARNADGHLTCTIGRNKIEPHILQKIQHITRQTITLHYWTHNCLGSLHHPHLDYKYENLGYM